MGKSDLPMYKVFFFLPSEQVTRNVDTLTEHTYDIISAHRSILTVTEYTYDIISVYRSILNGS